MWRYKICISLVIVGELKIFEITSRLQCYFSEILDAVERFTKVRIFLILLSI